MLHRVPRIVLACALAFPAAPSQAADAAPKITGAAADGRTLTVSWSASGAPVDAFAVQYSCDEGVTWTSPQHVARGLSTLVLATPRPATDCMVRIAEVQGTIVRAYSEIVRGMNVHIAPPTQVRVHHGATTVVSWKASTGDSVDHFDVYRSGDDGVSWTLVGSVPASRTSLSIAETGATAPFRVAAVALSGAIAFSEPVRGADESTVRKSASAAAAVDVSADLDDSDLRFLALSIVTLVATFAFGLSMGRRGHRRDDFRDFADDHEQLRA